MGICGYWARLGWGTNWGTDVTRACWMLNMPLSLFSTVCLSRIFAFSFANGVFFPEIGLAFCFLIDCIIGFSSFYTTFPDWVLLVSFLRFLLSSHCSTITFGTEARLFLVKSSSRKESCVNRPPFARLCARSSKYM
jgi:hypothetical protein